MYSFKKKLLDEVKELFYNFFQRIIKVRRELGINMVMKIE